MKALFTFINNIFNKTTTVVDKTTTVATKSVSVVEDAVDITKGYMMSMKAEEFYGEEKHLKDIDVKEIKDFYNSLYE